MPRKEGPGDPQSGRTEPHPLPVTSRRELSRQPGFPQPRLTAHAHHERTRPSDQPRTCAKLDEQLLAPHEGATLSQAEQHSRHRHLSIAPGHPRLLLALLGQDLQEQLLGDRRR